MRPVLFELPYVGIKVLGFGAMMVLALVASLGLAAWRARREKLNPDVFYDLGFWMIIGGVVGARLFFVLQHADAYKHLIDVVKFWEGGIVFYGSIIGGAIGFLIYRAFRPFPFRPAIDVVAPSLAIGVAFGRLGCFLNGCCFGDTCSLPWGVQFPFGSTPWLHHVELGLIAPAASHSLPVHPTQLYSVIDGLVLLVLLSAYYPLRKRDGEVMAVLMLTYPLTRFLIERLRDDESALAFGFTISQNISILIFLGGLVFCYYLSRLPVGRHADLASGPTESSPPLASGTLCPQTH